MTREKLNNDYFEWMCRLIGDQWTSYRKLLYLLFDRDFDYTLPMDGNRAEDGIDLRYRFGDEADLDQSLIASYLDDRSCSVLEMMVALAIRCEEHIMCDPDIGNRTSQWFWGMIENLGLSDMNDETFNQRYAENVISIFLNREYEPNGKGGLFTVQCRRNDLRFVEIWYQMCWYLDETM